MRVMWIVGRVPAEVSLAVDGDAHVSGGWQDALLAHARRVPGLELLVAHPGPTADTRIGIAGVEFASVGPIEPASRLARVFRRWSPSWPDATMVTACARLVAEWRPDLVHVHGTESGLGLVAELIETPLLISLQGLLSAYEATEVAQQERPASARPTLGEYLRGLAPRHEIAHFRAAAAAERSQLRAATFVAGRTRFDRRVAAVLAPQAPWLRVGEVLRDPFYDATQWAPKTGGASRDPQLLTGGAGYRRKGIDVAVQAVSILLKSGTPALLRVLAAPDSIDGRSAMAEAVRAGIGDRVSLCGVLSAEGVIAELQACDGLLVPSRSDNSPNTLCEGMLLGVPTVASTAGGIPSLITDGDDGLLVPPGDPYSLAGAVRQVLGDVELAAHLSRGARRRALARHDRARVTAELLEAYGVATGLAPRG